ncbi:MAG: thiamine diphosphokinase [Alphaproteobacteria bacterium]|nr:thiamine diphosphokinase [Alphaproteobacteria bacterium]
MSTFAILLGGTVKPTKRLKQQLTQARVIAADSGMQHAGTLALKPELWVGDFDSASLHLQKKHGEVPRQEFPVDKDATDGEIAIAEALRRGATRLILVGGFGGQFDHALAHAGFLLGLAKRGMDIVMTSGDEEAHALIDQLELDDLAVGTRLSIAPFTDLRGLTLSGVKWPLSRRDVLLGSALTLSNVVTGTVRMSQLAGSAIVLTYPTELE